MSTWLLAELDDDRHPDLHEQEHLYGVAHTTGGRFLPRFITAATPEEQEARLADPAGWSHHVAFEPSQLAIEGARQYAAARGLPDPHDVSYHDVMRDPDSVRQVGRAYDALPDFDPSAVPHYEAMRREVNDQYDHMTNNLGIQVQPVDHDPYPDVQHMMNDINNNKRLQVLGTHVTGGHPIFSNEDNDKFRAVHDFFGHAATGRSFDRHGEQAAFLAHSKMFSPQARPALHAETQGQNSSLILNGHFGPQKVAVMPEHLQHGIQQPAMPRAGRVAMPTYYHITDNSDFKLDPKFTPENLEDEYDDEGEGGTGWRHGPGVYLTQDRDQWRHSYPGRENRGYDAEFDAPDLRHQPGVSTPSWDGLGDPEEYFVPADKYHLLTPKGVKKAGPQARPALASETAGQNSSLILNGHFGPQKVATLHPDMVNSLLGQQSSAMPKSAMAEYDEYAGNHHAPGPESGWPVYDMTGMSGNTSDIGGVPEDWYTHPQYYNSGEVSPKDTRAVQQLYNHIRNNPEAPVDIYRALPQGNTDFNTGDWVTPSLAYARQHAMHPTDPTEDWPVIKSTVPAKHLYQNGDSYFEFGYHGPKHPGRTAANAQDAADMMRFLDKNPEGITVRHNVGDAPSSGFMVSHPGEREISRSRLDPHEIRQFQREHAEQLAEPDNYYGGWSAPRTTDEDQPGWYHDVSQNVHDPRDAAEMALRNHQQAVYDLDRGEEVSTPDMVNRATSPGIWLNSRRWYR